MFALYLVRIKHENKVALTVALIVAENVYQSVPCTVKTSFGKLFEVFPRKNNIVAVNEQILRAVIHGGFFILFSRLVNRRNRLDMTLFGSVFSACHRTVGLFKNLHKFLVESKNIVLSFALCKSVFAVCADFIVFRSIENTRQMHMLADLIPRHIVACSVRTEHRTAWIVNIGITIVADLCNNFIAVVARLVAFKTARKSASAVSVLHNFFCVVAHFGHGCSTRENGILALGFGRIESTAHPLNI